MRKFGYVVAAIAGLAIAAPTLASAETVVIKRGHHHMGMHSDFHRSHWHPHHHHDRVVVIKKHRY